MARIALFVFRRDFRLSGNPAWARCVEWCRKHRVRPAPCFIFSDKQTDSRRNHYFSPVAYSAMRQALEDLSRLARGRLSLFRVRDGVSDTALLAALSREHDLRAVFFNSDVTPFARARDDEIELWCTNNGVLCDRGQPGLGYLVWPAGSIATKAGTTPKTFTAFYRYTREKVIQDCCPDMIVPSNMLRLPPPSVEFAADGLPDTIPLVCVPDKDDVLAALEAGEFDNYGDTRNDYQERTTRLSVHLKFGTVDPWKVVTIARDRKIPDLERQLMWREFYYHLAYGYPEVISSPNRHIRPDRQRVKWSEPDKKKLTAWRKGETGEPLVDEAMAELNRTGYLHNRLRMVVASYLTRNMGVDWRAGERVMATMLVDYDPAQNSGGWQSMDAQIPGQEIKPTTQVAKYGHVTFHSEECPSSGH